MQHLIELMLVCQRSFSLIIGEQPVYWKQTLWFVNIILLFAVLSSAYIHHSVCLSICLSIYLSIYMSIHLSISVCLTYFSFHIQRTFCPSITYSYDFSSCPHSYHFSPCLHYFTYSSCLYYFTFFARVFLPYNCFFFSFHSNFFVTVVFSSIVYKFFFFCF